MSRAVPIDPIPTEQSRPSDATSSSVTYPKLANGKRSLPAELDLMVRALNATSNHILIVDILSPGRPIVFANKALAARHGKSVEQLIGLELDVFRGNAPHSDIIDTAMYQGHPFRTEIHAVRPDGSPFSMELALSPIRDTAGVVTHYLSVGTDITTLVEKKRELQSDLDVQTRQREHLEMELRLSQKLEAIGRLASGIAHEINTPIQYVGDSVNFAKTATDDVLAVLKLYRAGLQRVAGGADVQAVLAELTQAEKNADMEFSIDEMPRAFERTLQGVDRVATLVRAMKEFAHPQNSEQGPADINHALTTTLTVAGNEYKYCATVLAKFTELPPVLCNINELNQVFLNLIVNSVHAIQDAGRDPSTGRIEIGTVQVADSVEVTFTDNGCGIPQEHIDKIYDPFFTTKEVGRGTGQGLALTRTIVVDKHGGEIDVRSTVGVGTVFVIRLPIFGRPRSEG